MVWSQTSMLSSCLRVLRTKKCNAEKNEFEERFYLRNGGKLLEGLIISYNGKSNPIRTFSAEELVKATDSYAPDRIVHFQYREYTLYEGVHENRVILVKKFEGASYSPLEDCINEVVLASQMKHKNVLKLLGCCLESEIPILVYEFASNGLLTDHIYEDSRDTTKLPWESRLRIATEIAHVVAYLHMAFPDPIIHRDIRPQNIFLDENWVAKLSDFSQSKSIPSGETHVDVGVVRLIVGFVAPESRRTFRFTQKNDVFSFGMLLIVLLTGQSVSSLHQKAEALNVTLNDYMSSFLKNNYINEIVAPAILDQSGTNVQQLQAVLELAVRCRNKTAGERPTMLDVAKELKRIQTEGQKRSS